jgi:hypothetical protein
MAKQGNNLHIFKNKFHEGVDQCQKKVIMFFPLLGSIVLVNQCAYLTKRVQFCDGGCYENQFVNDGKH